MSARSTAPASGRERECWRVRRADGRDDAFELARVWQHYFGLDYDAGRLPFPLGVIAGWSDSSDEETPIATLGLLAEHHDVRVGVAQATIEDHSVTVDELPDGRFDKDSLAGDRNAWLWFGAVDPAWRGRGIGRRLFEERVQWADAQGADMAFAFGWERKDGPSSRPLFEASDFVPVQEFPDEYQESRTSCPDCGVWETDDNHCECSMTLWALDFDSREDRR